MGFMDFLGGLGSGIGDLFGGGSGAGSFISPEATQTGFQGFAPGGQFSDVAASVGGGGSTGGGFWDAFGSGLSGLGSLAQQAAPIAQLGATGLGIYGGIKGMQQGAEQMAILREQQEQQQRMAAPAAQAGGALTAAGSAALQGGALPPQLESQVETFKNEARARYRQYLAAQGLTDSSAAAQMDAWVESQAQQLRSQLAGNLYQGGLSGIGAAMGPSTAVSQTAMGVVGGSQGSLEAANKALADLLGSN